MNRNITALILIVLAVGIYFTFTKDQLTQAKEVKRVNDEYARAIDSAKELVRVRERVLKEYNEIPPSELEKLDRMIPATVDNIRLAMELNAIARNNGISIQDIEASVSKEAQEGSGQAQMPGSPDDPQSIVEPMLDSVTVTFSATAPYQQFISFLQALESNLRVMDVTRLSLQTNDTGMYDYEVELKTYWVRQ